MLKMLFFIYSGDFGINLFYFVCHPEGIYAVVDQTVANNRIDAYGMTRSKQ